MTLAVTIVSTLVFLIALHSLGVIRVGRNVVTVANRALETLRDTSLDDEQKEQIAQQSSIALTKAFVSITVRGAATLALSFVPVLLADYAGFVSVSETLEFMSSWEVILGLTVAICAFYFIGLRLWRST